MEILLTFERGLTANACISDRKKQFATRGTIIPHYQKKDKGRDADENPKKLRNVHKNKGKAAL
jgi:hypothetical protein